MSMNRRIVCQERKKRENNIFMYKEREIVRRKRNLSIK